VEDPLSIGATLRDARLRQNLEISECAHATRIRERYLVAIEDGRFESLPDPAYVNGFVRAYATHLGVTIEGPIQDLPEELQPGMTAGRARPSHRRPVTVRATRITARGAGQRRPRWRSWPVLVLVAIVAVLIVASLLGADIPVVG
jgi:cytoskeletal protein RodZ